MTYPCKEVINHYLAHVNQVVDVPRLDVTFDLGFSVFARRIFTVRVPDLDASEHYKDAMHCLVILVGGKDVFLEMSSESAASELLTGSAYVERPEIEHLPFKLERRLYASPPLMSVADCLLWCAAHRFNPKMLRSTLKNGES